ncbi:MAG: hypothetical protein RL684_2475 [Pseudomonadota bacterium]|jgi:transcriptional regulator with XRE-family HTH domain
MSGTNSLPVRVATIIREHRERMGLSQEAFADELGFHRAYYGRIENGQNMTLLTLQRVAEGLGVPAWQLLKDADQDGSAARPLTKRKPLRGAPKRV